MFDQNRALRLANISAGGDPDRVGARSHFLPAQLAHTTCAGTCERAPPNTSRPQECDLAYLSLSQVCANRSVEGPCFAMQLRARSKQARPAGCQTASRQQTPGANKMHKHKRTASMTLFSDGALKTGVKSVFAGGLAQGADQSKLAGACQAGHPKTPVDKCVAKR